MEQDNEVSGNGNSYDFGARVYNPRIGRWNSMDNKAGVYYSSSPYNFAGDNPIMFVDNDGNIIEIHGSKRYIKTVMAELQKLSDIELRYDAKTKTVSYVAPKDIAIPKKVGNSLLLSLIDSKNTTEIMSTSALTGYANKHGGVPAGVAEMGYETFVKTESGKLVNPDGNLNDSEFAGMDVVVHFSDFLDKLPEVTMMDMTRESPPSFIVLGHELIHAQYFALGLVVQNDFRNGGGRNFDAVDIASPLFYTSKYGLLTYHEADIRKQENLLRKEQGLDPRHDGSFDERLFKEFQELSEGIVDPDGVVIIEGSGNDIDDLEFWREFMEAAGYSQDVVDEINKSNDINKELQDAYQSSKGAKKAKKANRHRWYRWRAMRREKPKF